MVTPLYDESGLPRARSSVVMDLGRIALPNPKPKRAQRLKGKMVKTAVPAPVEFVSLTSDPSLLMPASAIDSSTPPVCTDPLIPSAPISAVTSVKEPLPAAVPMASTSSSWAKIASTAPVTPQSLKFVEPIFTTDPSVISIPTELLAIGHKKYSMCLVGQFIGNTPKVGLIHTVLNKLWGRDGEVSVSPNKDGLFLFQLPNEAAYSRALYHGPWHVEGVPLILCPWRSSVKK
ncbi:hypothetical protein Tsubulata_011478 [Turnera subulata]|uniref:DUF4283 domain-containing protein n=1 Tax=Turnera subulata TaxID=218843 RepID=A0A9Q0GFD6_9ROSI|nr:hypothetical protein Tsubulata_011478 [Turnera subulata]